MLLWHLNDSTFIYSNYAVHEVFKTRDTILKDEEAGGARGGKSSGGSGNEETADVKQHVERIVDALLRKQQKQEQHWNKGI